MNEEIVTVDEEAEAIVEAIKETVPAEKQEELVEAIEEAAEALPAVEPPPTKGVEYFKWLFANVVKRPSTGTPAHGNKRRGVGVTRKVKEQSKKARKQSKQSRRINRGK